MRNMPGFMTRAVERAASLGWAIHEFDYRPFRYAADLLYQGPWVAERYSAAKSLVETNPHALHPVVRSDSCWPREKFSAVDAFEAQYRLAELARESEKTWQSADALLLPSAGTIYTIEQILAAPIELNSNLGRYTEFHEPAWISVESPSPRGFGLTEFLLE